MWWLFFLTLAGFLWVGNKQRCIMVSQAQVTERLRAVEGTLNTVATESTELVAEVARLKEAIEAGSDASPELIAALEAVEARAKHIDELVPTPGSGGGEEEVPLPG